MKKTLMFVMSSVLAAALAVPVMAAQPAATPAPKAAAAKTVKQSAVKTAPTAQEIADAKAKGLVWVNLSTKVYHTEGKYYGTTKHGKFMTKDEAEKAGFKAAKEPVAKSKPAKPSPASKKS